MTEQQLTLGSLFDGSGGFPLAGKLAGIRPVWASEIEPFPIRVTTKRLPEMAHLGDIRNINGGKIQPVDIITFGSPCTDLSVAGQRAGLNGSQSSLFFEAVRIIKEMRDATHEKYPRFIVWENVPGSLSSNQGCDFATVLESLIHIKGETVSVPMPEKWTDAGEVLGETYSLAWRILDAQFWGVAQRRRRVFLVADFGRECAGKILFESESVSKYSAENQRTRQGTACPSLGGADPAISFEPGAMSRLGGHFQMEQIPTLRAKMGDNQTCVAVNSNPSDARFKIDNRDRVQTLKHRMGTGGGNVPLILEKTQEDVCNMRDNALPFTNDTSFILTTAGCKDPQCITKSYGIGSYDSAGMKSKNPQTGIYPADTSRTIDQNGGNPACKQGGIALVKAECTKKCDHPVAIERKRQYAVRRLTPTECARLQGFPDWWCRGLETPEPSDGDISFWREVFETHRKGIGTSTRPKSDKQIIKWLKSPHSDSAEYKMWGNGVSLPCVYYVMCGIVRHAEV